MKIRLNKFLTNANYCSRRAADRLIEAKKIKINDRLAVLGDKIGDNDRIFVDGKEIVGGRTSDSQNKIYLAFNKPVGVICTTDKNSPNNIIDYIKYPERVYPIGRLDVNSSGLILLTNDGEIVNKILKAEEKTEKEYLVDVDKTMSNDFISKMQKSFRIDGQKTIPATITQIADRRFSIVIVEGKKRQIRRMCEQLGVNVVRLHRTRIGKLSVNKLKIGEHQKISRDDIISE